jgi:hypothetical protein
MTELQPLYDTAGAGLSLLDTILHTRVSLEGVVSRTVTRLLYACKYSSGASPQELCEHQAQLLSDADPEATGLLLVQPTSFWGFVETSPETVAALLRWIDSELPRADGEGRLRSCRVIVQIEDCPSRAFGPWSYRSLMLPPESGVIDLDAQSPVALSSQFYHTAMSIGAAMLEAGPSVRCRNDESRLPVGIKQQARSAVRSRRGRSVGRAPHRTPASLGRHPLQVLDQLQERFGSGLPSDERVCALSEWNKVRDPGTAAFGCCVPAAAAVLRCCGFDGPVAITPAVPQLATRRQLRNSGAPGSMS